MNRVSLRARLLIICSLAFTFVFFRKYLPGRNRVHIPYDLLGYHYPLANYAFTALRHGRLPQWDPTIYSGMSFVGNPQAALFYPPQWLAFVFSWRYAQLPYHALQFLTFAHVCLAFLLCFFWLNRQQRLYWPAAIIGGGAFAFSGYMMTQLQHLGLIGAYTWIPLGFWGIDEAAEKRDWRPLWKLAVAFALCILAGYPTMWVVFAVCMVPYALVRRNGIRLAAWVSAALLISALFAAVQVLPAMEVAGEKIPEPRYSRASGIKDPAFYLSYAVPNYYNFNLKTEIHTNFGQEYLYLGAPALVGLALLLRSRRRADIAALAAVLGASLFFEVNPFGWFGRMIEGTPLDQIFSAYYFLAGITAACAPLAAIGLDAGLKTERKIWPAWLAWPGIGLTIAWSVHLLLLWKRDNLPIQFASVYDAAAGVLLACLLIAAAVRSRGITSIAAAGALILLSAFEYKAFGTSKRFNAETYPLSAIDLTGIRDVSDEAREALLTHPEYRLALEDGNDSVLLRAARLSTPQGRDPILPQQYKRLIDTLGHFVDNRNFNLDPENEAALRLLGVGYFRVRNDSKDLVRTIEATGKFHLIPSDKYFRIYALNDATPAFAWDQPGAGQSARMTKWAPEQRRIEVDSAAGGIFRLSEEDLPGWTASVDGHDAPISSCHYALQCVNIPAGKHTLEFHYRSRWLIPGAALSMISILVAAGIFRTRSGANH